jgi:hypothetical protein
MILNIPFFLNNIEIKKYYKYKLKKHYKYYMYFFYMISVQASTSLHQSLEEHLISLNEINISNLK